MAQRRGWQLDHLLALQAATAQAGQGHADRGAQRQGRRAIQSDLDQKGAAERIGTGRHLAHAAFQLGGLRPGAHKHFLARFNDSHLVFRHRKLHLTRAIGRHPQHGGTGGQHLAHLGLHGGDHARDVGPQAGVSGLVGLHGQLGLGLVELGLGGLEGGVPALKLGAADEVLLLERLKPLEVGRRQVTLGAGSFCLRTRRINGQLQITGVQLRQHLADLHGLTDLHHALGQLAIEAKAQAGLHPGPHLT